MLFEWNPTKAERNQRKHGVSFREAMEVFRDPLSVTFSDRDRSDEEDRFLIIGLSLSRNVLVVAHTYRDDHIRIISARLATKKERAFYVHTTRH